VIACLVAWASVAHAQKVQVYTKPIEPFSFQEDGKALGFSIELWDRVAREAHLDYELHWVKKVGDDAVLRVGARHPPAPRARARSA